MNSRDIEKISRFIQNENNKLKQSEKIAIAEFIYCNSLSIGSKKPRLSKKKKNAIRKLNVARLGDSIATYIKSRAKKADIRDTLHKIREVQQ